jgi:hypothetical protein
VAGSWSKVKGLLLLLEIERERSPKTLLLYRAYRWDVLLSANGNGPGFFPGPFWFFPE